MSIQQAQRKKEFAERIAEISQPGFIRQHVCAGLAESSGAAPDPDSIQVCVVQNDGTGPATVEYRMADSTRVFAKLYADESGVHAHEVLHSLWHEGFDRGQRYQVPEPLGFV